MEPVVRLDPYGNFIITLNPGRQEVEINLTKSRSMVMRTKNEAVLKKLLLKPAPNSDGYTFFLHVFVEEDILVLREYAVPLTQEEAFSINRQIRELDDDECDYKCHVCGNMTTVCGKNHVYELRNL